MELSSRVKQLLAFMLKAETVVSVDKLSQSVKVSKRTIQRELEYLPKTLKAYDLTFCSKTGVGVWIQGNEQKKLELLKTLSGEATPDVSDREYRRKMLTLELLKEKGLKKLYWYSSKFKVSEATISTDLEFLNEWFELYDLKITKKPGSGISVDGSEENYRKAISAFVSQNINDKTLNEIYTENVDTLGVYEKIKKAGITQMLNEEILKRVINCLNCMQSEQINTLTESSFMSLCLHIAIAVNRIIQNESIAISENKMLQIKSDSDYALAQNIALELEDEFEINVTKNEIDYIYLHIKASKHEKIAEQNTQELGLSAEKLKFLINEMIYAFDPEKAYLLKQDEEFLQGLLVHMQPTLVRLLNNMQIQNPVLSEIKKQYPQIFERCKSVAKVMEQNLNVKVPEEEVGFMAVHFGAALVRLDEKKEVRRVVNVGVVCSSGIGVSRLMATKLKKIYKDKISLKAYSKRELTEKECNELDFIITSINFDIKNIEVILVNPLLNEKNLESISNSISKYEKTLYKNAVQINDDVGLDKILYLVTQIKKIVDDFKLVRLEKDVSFDNLMDKILPIIHKNPENQLQIKKDIIEREKISTQIFSEFQFALFHARTTGVSEPKFAVFLSEDLGEFSHKSLKQIKMAMVMLIPKDDNTAINAEILGHISSSIIENDELIKVILTADLAMVKKQLSKVLKSLLIYILNNE